MKVSKKVTKSYVHARKKQDKIIGDLFKYATNPVRLTQVLEGYFGKITAQEGLPAFDQLWDKLNSAGHTSKAKGYSWCDDDAIVWAETQSFKNPEPGTTKIIVFISKNTYAENRTLIFIRETWRHSSFHVRMLWDKEKLDSNKNIVKPSLDSFRKCKFRSSHYNNNLCWLGNAEDNGYVLSFEDESNKVDNPQVSINEIFHALGQLAQVNEDFRK